MQLTLGDVISLSTRFAGRSDFSSSEASALANLALTEVSNRLLHKPKEALAVSNITGTGNERSLELPTDFDTMFGLKFYSTSTDAATGENILGTEYDLPITDTSTIDSHSSLSGIPERYALWSNTLELDPIPNSRGSLIMRYAAKQQTLILSSETPALDERWHPGWLWKTTELVNLARSNSAGAMDAERRYVNYMVSTPNDRQREQMAKNGMGLSVRKK